MNQHVNGMGIFLLVITTIVIASLWMGHPAIAFGALVSGLLITCLLAIGYMNPSGGSPNDETEREGTMHDRHA